MKRLPTRQEIDEHLSIDVAKGEIYKKPRSGKGHRKSDAWKRVGWVRPRNRSSHPDRQIDFHAGTTKFRVPEHWLIWFWVHSAWPDYPREVIDHKDGNPLNNALSNLRLCTHGENIRNGRLRKSNQTRYKWVQRHGDVYSFRMSGYPTARAAYEAACKAARELHGEFFNDGRIATADTLNTRG